MANEVNQRLSGKIVQFPGRFRPAGHAAGKLNHAIRELDQANTKLRDVTADWQRMMAALAFRAGEVTENLRGLDDKFATVSQQRQHVGDE